MTTDITRTNKLYFYLYMAALLLFPLVYYFTQDGIVTNVAFYVAALTCMYLDQKELVKSGCISKIRLVGSVLRTVFFPPAYVYCRAEDEGLKKWRWFFASIAIGLGSVFIYLNMAEGDSIKTTACEVTTSIFKDKNSDVKCLTVEDLKKVSDKHYRAKALLSNGVDMPITIEEANDDYIYVTLTPLTNLLD